MICPKCNVEMKVVEESGTQTHECPVCGGIWVDNVEEKDVLRMKPAVFTVEELQQFKKIYTPPGKLEEVKYFKCPRCGDLMWRKNYMHHSGIVVDKCAKHGTFFDKGELEKATEFIKKGGIEHEKLKLSEKEILDMRDRLTREISRVETTTFRLHWIGRFLSLLRF